MPQAKSIKRPSAAAIGRIAERQPQLLNLLLAFFVFEWQSVRISGNGTASHGTDQMGLTRLVPDYVGQWTDYDRCGVNTAVHLLLRCPLRRQLGDPGYLTRWMQAASLGRADDAG